MPIRQFVLEPPVSIDWNHRPISSQLKLDKNSKLLILNDSSIADLDKCAEKKHINVVFCNQAKRPELLLIPEVVGDNQKLNTLVDTYFSLGLSHNVQFSRGSLTLLLRIMYCASDKSYRGILNILRKWFEAPKNKLAKLITEVKIDKKMALPKIEKAILTFAKATDYTENILNFLWKLHGANAWSKKSKKEINSLNTAGQITVMPASVFKENTYFYALLIYGVKSHIEVYIDSDVSFTLVQPYLKVKADTFSIARYANSDSAELAFIASKAENMLSSAQIPDQSLFFAWLAYKDTAALADYSLKDINRLLSVSPYVTYVGMYFTLIKSQFCLTQYDITKYHWSTHVFDLKYIISKTIDKNKKQQNSNFQNTQSKISSKPIASIDSKSLVKATQKVLDKIDDTTSDFKATVALLSSKVNSLSEVVNKDVNETSIKKSDKASQINVDLKDVQHQLKQMKQNIDLLPNKLSDLIKKSWNETEEQKNDPYSWEDADDPKQLEKDYDKAIHGQSNNFTDFDD